MKLSERGGGEMMGHIATGTFTPTEGKARVVLQTRQQRQAGDSVFFGGGKGKMAKAEHPLDGQTGSG